MSKSSAQKRGFLNVPLMLCKHIVANKIFNQAKLYLLLKWVTDGEVVFTNDVAELCMAELKICKRTFERNLKWLIKERWIIHEYGLKYRIIGFKPLCHELCEPTTKSGFLWDNPDFTMCKAFVIAACLTKCVNIIRVRRGASAKGRARFTSPTFLNDRKHIVDEAILISNKNCYMAKSYFAKFLGIPLTTAFDYIQFAVKSGLIVKKKHTVRTTISNKQLHCYRKYCPAAFMPTVYYGKGEMAMMILPNSYASNLYSKKIKDLFTKDDRLSWVVMTKSDRKGGDL